MTGDLAEELRGIAGRLICTDVAQACDGEQLVVDFLALNRAAGAVERMEEALRPRTRREIEGARAARKRGRKQARKQGNPLTPALSQERGEGAVRRAAVAFLALLGRSRPAGAGR